MIKNKKLIIAFCAVFLTVESLIGVFIHKSNGIMLYFNQFYSIVFACCFCILFMAGKVRITHHQYLVSISFTYKHLAGAVKMRVLHIRFPI